MQKLTLVCLAGMVLASAAAAEWNEPAGWSEIGTVVQWMDADSHFYRIEGLTASRSSLFEGMDQKEIYRKTLGHDSHLPKLDLQAFLALPASVQRERRDAANGVLNQVRGFGNRLADLVMRVRNQQDVGWGLQDMDPRVVDGLLQHLQTAVGLDPANPYAWHLLAYFRGIVGDELRALEALEGLDGALAEIPDDALTGMRHRALLDRAWLMRDRGNFEQAAGALDRAAVLNRPGLEEQLLRGLLAAQTGDQDRAFRLAAELDGVAVPVFQQDWEAKSLAPGILDPMAWPTKPSGHLKGWILALAWLREGNTDMARQAFAEYNRLRHYAFGHRFWNEAGAIYETTGRRDLADKAWGLAQMYTPFYPYQISKPYALDLSGITGRLGNQPFMVGYDSFFNTGSRLAYGAALASWAMAAKDRSEQVELGGRAAGELEICRRSGLNTAAAALMSGHAQAALGNVFEMLRAADLAEAALDRPDQDQTCRPKVEALRRAASGNLQGPGMSAPGLWRGQPLAWDPGEDPAQTEIRLRKRVQDEPGDDQARRDLARFLLRHGNPVEGAALARETLDLEGNPPLEDLILILEVDRLQNDPVRAGQLLGLLLEGRGDRWPDARLWILVGFICQDNGIPEGRRALEYALELDPENQGLVRHLEMTGNRD